MSHRALSPEQFFHGTSSVVGDVTHVLPPALAGVEDGREPHYASVTEREDVAWRFAHETAEYRGGKPVVLVTGRAPDQQLGPEHVDHPYFVGERGGDFDHAEHISRVGFPVIGRREKP